MLVWVVADATIDGSETGTSFRHALGFMDRGLKLHDTMIWEKLNPVPLRLPHRYLPAFDFMFVFSSGRIQKSNLLTKPNIHAGSRHTGRGQKRQEDAKGFANGIIQMRGTRPNVWGYKTGTNGKLYAPDFPDAAEHSSIYPYALAADHIRTWTNPGDLVIDPMARSGTTIRAAVNLGRRAVGIEIHKPYVDLIHRRMAQQVMELSENE